MEILRDDNFFDRRRGAEEEIIRPNSKDCDDYASREDGEERALLFFSCNYDCHFTCSEFIELLVVSVYDDCIGQLAARNVSALNPYGRYVH